MNQYAIIEAGIVANVVLWDGNAENWQPPSGATAIAIPVGQVVNPGYTWNGAIFSAPPTPANTQTAVQQAAAAWAAYQANARAALNVSDVTILRCYESGVVVPTTWTIYRRSLRAIMSATSGDATQPMPAKPPYPSGT